MSEYDFDERTLFEPLDGEPDPTFEAQLLVRLYEELSSTASAPGPAHLHTAPAPDEDAVLLEPDDLQHEGARRVPWLALAAAAFVLIAGLVALWPSDEPPVVADRPDPPPNIGVAEAFMAARAAGDAATLQALVAGDADIVYRFEWIDDSADYPALLEWESIAEVTFDDVECADGSPGRVRCTYFMTTRMASALGYDGWTNSFVFDIRDGTITTVSHQRTELDGVENVADSYHLAVFATQFGPWVDNTYPGEWEILTAEGALNEARSPHFTDEALALWETRIPEFIASLTEG